MKLPHSQTFLALLLTFVILFLHTAATFELIATNVTNVHMDPTDAVASSVCYLTGEFGDIVWFNENIHNICFNVFGGWYSQNGGGRTGCFNTGLSRPKSYWFAIFNLDRDHGRNLDPWGCVTFMKKISDECPRGGDWPFFDWQFRVDPEHKANCVDI